MTTIDPDSALPLEAAIGRRARRRSLLRRVGGGLRTFARRSPFSAFWGCVALAIIVMAIAAPLIAPYDPLKSDFRAMAKPPTEKHWFGTDQIGRDVLSRVIYGARASLTVAIGAVLFGTTLGALWGLASGYFGGRFDIVSQRIIEFLQSFPDLILAMAIAMALGAGIGTVIVAIAITRIPFGGRVIRSVVLSLKEIQYIEAARGLGASHLRMMARHILPQCIAPYPDPGDGASRRRDHHRGLARLSRGRHPAADPDLGQHAGRLAECRASCRRGGWCCFRGWRSR